jgi:putative acetyltransferase
VASAARWCAPGSTWRGTALGGPGHKGYYPRFGFSAALARPLEAPFSGDAFMALELAPDALRGEKGRVTYPPAFGVTND